MDTLSAIAVLFVLALLRYLPAVVLPGMSPLTWAPGMVRLVIAIAFAWLTVLATPDVYAAGWINGPVPLAMAAMHELMIGFAFGLVVMIPQAALHSAGWLMDIQAGLGAATLFNPGSQGDAQSLLGTALMLLATVMFFLLDLHVELYRVMVASVQVLPLGGHAGKLQLSGVMDLVGNSFLFALIVVAPVALGLFAVDVGVGYATRSMPQANIYFLVLPLKIGMAILLLAATLPFAPGMIERLYRDAFARLPTILGA